MLRESGKPERASKRIPKVEFPGFTSVASRHYIILVLYKKMETDQVIDGIIIHSGGYESNCVLMAIFKPSFRGTLLQCKPLRVKASPSLFQRIKPKPRFNDR